MKEKAMQGKLLSEIRTKAEAVSTINVHFEQRVWIISPNFLVVIIITIITLYFPAYWHLTSL